MSFIEFSPTLTVTNQNPGSTFTFEYQKMKDTILGNNYSLSIVFATAEISEQLHIQYKKKDGPATVLSFPYSESEGEIVLHTPTVYARAKKEHHHKRDHVAYHIIHGMLHLAGFDHGPKMDQDEKKYLELFELSIPPALK